MWPLCPSIFGGRVWNMPRDILTMPKKLGGGTKPGNTTLELVILYIRSAYSESLLVRNGTFQSFILELSRARRTPLAKQYQSGIGGTLRAPPSLMPMLIW